MKHTLIKSVSTVNGFHKGRINVYSSTDQNARAIYHETSVIKRSSANDAMKDADILAGLYRDENPDLTMEILEGNAA